MKDIPFDYKLRQPKEDAGLHLAPNERCLLEWFLARLQRTDPDIIIGHNILDNHFDLILTRCQKYNLKNWSKLGRVKKTEIPKMKNNRSGYYACAGRSVCDLKISAKELIRSRAYDLHTLWDVVMASGLNSKRFRKEFSKEFNQKQIFNAFSDCDGLFPFVKNQLVIKTYQTFQMICELQAIPLAFQITKICGNILNRTFAGGRSERNEYLLLHAFQKTNRYLWPDKAVYKTKKERAEENEENTNTAKYEGGLVLEPKKGFYDKYVLLLDFNSLYPSIIQEYNVCFTSVDQTQTEIVEPETEGGLGILPLQIRELVSTRRTVKKAMNSERDPAKKAQLDIRQKALKLTANSMYGCLGFSMSRFQAMPLAALVTRKGREALMKAKELAESMGLDVIYGDTDSIMIHTNTNDFDEVLKIGQKVKVAVNRLFSLLEIEIDGVFRSMLLLKKKKYAALVDEGTDSKGDHFYKKELKGLDIVRRDWCTLAKQTGEWVVGQILTPDITMEEAVTTIREKLENIKDSISSMSPAQFIITKELARDPANYPEKSPQAHARYPKKFKSYT